MEYREFLEKKKIIHKPNGFNVELSDIHPVLFDHQRALTQYALRKGVSAILADTGLGKTNMELEWARLVCQHTSKPVLIVMPLYVAYQTIEAAKDLLDQDIIFVENKDDITGTRVHVTNYEKLHKFIGLDFGGIAYDESSIFKGMDSKTFKTALEVSKGVSFRLCASATPAPNSIEEIGRQAEVLGIMTLAEMRATFFVNRQEGKKGQRQGWQLRPHANKEGPLNFWRWLASWAMAVKLPSDLGFNDEGYILPDLTITPIFVESGYVPDGQLIFTGLSGITDRSQVRKRTLEVRCQEAAKTILDDDNQWIVWCGLNNEANRMKQLLGDCSVNVQGSDKVEKKIKSLKSFVDGNTQVLISKTKICGHGANFQHCHKMAFVGLNDSWEQFYQAVKRIHRFMQIKPCEVYIFLAEEERQIWENVQRKNEEAIEMTQKLIENAREYQREELDNTASSVADYQTDSIKTDKYHIMLGDSAERLGEVETESVGLSIYSPPFEDLFVYSNTERDLGNSATQEDFYAHYGYIVEELFRVTIPGRKTVVHAADIHYVKGTSGRTGLKPFVYRLIELYENYGWEWQGVIPIAKNPQAAAIRGMFHELMFATMNRDAARLMPVQPDYLVVFDKPGKNSYPILPKERFEMNEDTWIVWAGNTWLNGLWEKLENDGLTEQDFIEIAKQVYHQYKSSSPIWSNIKETKVLPFKGKKQSRLDEDDTKHICPLQLEPVERAIKLWSNPRETVLTPFMGIGTEVYQAVMFDRYGIGIELKPEYFYQAYKNIKEADRLSEQEDLFSMAGIKV